MGRYQPAKKYVCTLANKKTAFTATALIAGVVFGAIVDVWNCSKSIALGINLLSIVGNAMYLIGGHRLTLLTGRVVAGKSPNSSFQLGLLAKTNHDISV
jgi:hypothetical protein